MATPLHIPHFVRKSSIIRRWVVNIMGVILFFLLIFSIAFVLSIRSYYYKSVEYSLTFRADSMESVLSQYPLSTLTTSAYDTLVREFVENFADKEKLELQVVNTSGMTVMSSTGFAVERTIQPDYQLALQAENKRTTWIGKTSAGEHIMSLTLVLPRDDGKPLGALRFVTSLKSVDRQIWIFLGLICSIGLAVLFFVMMSSSYFINSIVHPVSEINRAARQIALGDYNSRIVKKTDDEIGDLCDTINYMAGEISAGERMKNDFISSVSHELRTPLTAIKGWAETMQQAGPADAELTEKGLEVIVCESERLSGIVEELLDFSRMQGGRLVMKFERMDVLAELSEAVVLFRDRAAREGIQLQYIEPERLPPIVGDKDRLKQVFINVLDNAIKYSNRGGRIRIETAEMGNSVQIVISDTGVGIAKADLPNVKQKFYKAEHSRPGSGIGLALADEILRRHKGRLDIDSEEGVGTAVTITLPITPAEHH